MEKQKALDEITTILALYATRKASETLTKYGSDSEELKWILGYYLDIAKALDIEQSFLKEMKMFGDVEYILNH